MKQLLLFCLALLCTAVPSLAVDSTPKDNSQSTLVNLETPAVTPVKTLSGKLDIRFFDHPEDIVYTSATLRYGLFDHLELGVRGVTSASKGLAVPAGGTLPRRP